MTDLSKNHSAIKSGSPAFKELHRFLLAVSGGESLKFLNGLVTNDVTLLGEGEGMRAVFPNAQGRILAPVELFRVGDTVHVAGPETLRDVVFKNLSRFVPAGEFFVEDLSDSFIYFELWNFDGNNYAFGGGIRGGVGSGCFVQAANVDALRSALSDKSAFEVDADLYETLRLEARAPLWGCDMDENTVVPEIGPDGIISYNKGCYIGQEVIARIHFRGHVAKQLRLVVCEGDNKQTDIRGELTSVDGKPAGRVTSSAFSPNANQVVGLGMVRYEFLKTGTPLLLGDTRVTVA